MGISEKRIASFPEVARPRLRPFGHCFECMLELSEEGSFGDMALASIPGPLVLDLGCSLLEESKRLFHRSER
jgi:hypothetical protein